MTAKMGVRDITRNFSTIENYDYVEIEDKKTHTIKGLFVSGNFVEDVKMFIEQKLKAAKQQEINEMMSIVGKGKIEKRFDNLTSKEIRQKKAEEKYAD